MKMPPTSQRTALVWAVSLSLVYASGFQVAQAATVSAETVLAAQQQEAAAATQAAVNAQRQQILATLQRADVAQALAERGVDAGAARDRVQALSDQEVVAVADRLDQLPAGASDVLGTIVFIFLVLLVTDILGFTKVFPFTRSIR
jgi:cytochrome c1